MDENEEHEAAEEEVEEEEASRMVAGIGRERSEEVYFRRHRV